MLGVVIQYFYAQKWGEISKDPPPKKSQPKHRYFYSYAHTCSAHMLSAHHHLICSPSSRVNNTSRYKHYMWL